MGCGGGRGRWGLGEDGDGTGDERRRRGGGIAHQFISWLVETPTIQQPGRRVRRAARVEPSANRPCAPPPLGHTHSPSVASAHRFNTGTTGGLGWGGVGWGCKGVCCVRDRRRDNNSRPQRGTERQTGKTGNGPRAQERGTQTGTADVGLDTPPLPLEPREGAARKGASEAHVLSKAMLPLS